MKLIFTLIVLLASSTCFGSIQEAMQSTVRFYTYYEVDVDGKTIKRRSGGSGVVYKEDDTHLFLLTAAHIMPEKKDMVVEKDGPKIEFDRTKITAQFFTNGFSSPEIEAKLLWSHLRGSSIYNDMAELSVKKSDLGRYPLPKPIPLAEKTKGVRYKDRIMSCGCPNLSWPTAWFGHVSETPFSVNVFKFIPPPIGGRSGSAIFNMDGTKVIGIIIWKSSGSGGGTAISPYGIHRQLEAFGNVQR